MIAVCNPPVRALLGFLRDLEVNDLHVFALRNLNDIAFRSWFEIADGLPDLEESFEKNRISPECRQLTALLLSQIYFHLEQANYAMKYALLAESEFLQLFTKFYGESAPPPSMDPQYLAIKQFVDVIIGSVIEYFIKPENDDESFSAEMEKLSSQRENLLSHILGVENMRNLPLSERAIELLLGIALESKQIELVEKFLRVGTSRNFAILRNVVRQQALLMPSKHFRLKVFELVGNLYAVVFAPLLALAVPDNGSLPDPTCPEPICPDLPKDTLDELPNYVETLFYLEDGESAARVLRALVTAALLSSSPGGEENYLRALQLAFDLVTFGSQAFLAKLRSHPLLLASSSHSETAAKTETEEHSEEAPESSAIDTKQVDQAHIQLTEKLQTLQHILLGDTEILMNLKFVHQKNATDLEILDAVKNGLDTKHNVLHTSLIIAHGLMQRGTTCDVFLRKNLDWFGRALCWGKFSAIASLGVVHQTHADKSFRVLSTYLPGYNASGSANATNSSFSDGGSLYALGLIHANRSDQSVVNYLLNQLSSGSGLVGGQMATENPGPDSSTVNEISQHGASLGLGLVALGSQSNSLYEALRFVLLMDSAVSGEAAALGIGLIMIGSGKKDAIEELLQYAKDTRHEKIIRACGLAVALLCYRNEEDASSVTEKMITDSEAWIRYGGCFALGLAWCGTGRESAVRSLLHVAVSDSSNDVRRAAVLAVSYVLCDNPEQTPRILRLLSDSFNFHVRYAANLAIGISCAGTASEAALQILVPATKDSADVVRQAAYIALGLVLMECPDKNMQEIAAKQKPSGAVPVKKVKEATTERARKNARAAADSELPPYPTPTQLREHFIGVATDRRDDVMARVGAIIGLGLLEAGGRNCTASFYSSRGILRREAVVGFLLFSQYWYWYPLMLNISLTLQPTVIIGLNANLKVPEGFTLTCDAPASHFAYPKVYQPKKKEVQVQSVFALLSAAHRRMGVKPTAAASSLVERDKKETEETNTTPPQSTEDSIEEEPPTHVISNMSRVLPGEQASKVDLVEGSRYHPIFPGREKSTRGIIVLVDTMPGEADKYLESSAPNSSELKGGAAASTVESHQEEEEAALPEPFELE